MTSKKQQNCFSVIINLLERVGFVAKFMLKRRKNRQDR